MARRYVRLCTVREPSALDSGGQRAVGRRLVTCRKPEWPPEARAITSVTFRNLVISDPSGCVPFSLNTILQYVRESRTPV